MLSLKKKYTFGFSYFLITGLCNSSANHWLPELELIRVSLLASDFLSKICKPLRQDLFDFLNLNLGSVCISGMNLLPANNNLFTISFILYLSNKMFPNNGILLKGVFNSKLVNNSLTSCFLINLDLFLL